MAAGRGGDIDAAGSLRMKLGSCNIEPGEPDSLRRSVHVQAALGLAAWAHLKVFRNDGTTPSLYHLFRVACAVQHRGGSGAEICAALLHDTKEDAGLTEEDIYYLLAHGMPDDFSREVIRLWEALSRRPGEGYNAYIDRVIAAGQGAILIKICDIEDNSHPTREGGCPESLAKKRYEPTLKRLRACQKEG